MASSSSGSFLPAALASATARPVHEASGESYYRRQLDAVCNNATVSLFVMNERQQCVYMNPAAENLTGYTLAEVSGRILHDVIHHTRPDGRPYPLAECRIDRAFPENIQEQGEEIFVHKDGSFYPVAFTASPIREGREVVGTIIEVRGTEEEKRAQAEREQLLALEQEAREETETLNRLGQMLSAELDLQRLVQAVTDAATELTGAQFGCFFYNLLDAKGASYTLYTLSGMPREAFEGFGMPRATELFGPTVRGEGAVRIADVTKDKRFGHNSLDFGMPEGQPKVVSYLTVPVTSRSGEVIGGLFFGHHQAGVFSERHERLVVGLAAQTAIAVDNARLFKAVQSERASAQAAHQQVNNLLESITDAFFAVDEQWRFTYVNQNAQSLLLRSREDLLGKNLWQEFPAAIGTIFEEQYRKALQEHVSVKFMEFYPPPLDSWYEVHAYPLQGGLSVYFHNINERIAVQKVLEERTRLAELSAEVGLSLTAGGELRVVLSSCCQALCKYLHATSAHVWTLSREQNTLDLQASAGTNISTSSVDMKAEIAQIVQLRRPHMVNGTHADEAAFAGFPLVVDDEVVGVVALLAREPLTPVALEAMASIANAMALGIERQNTEEERLRLLDSERAARELAETLNRSKDEFLATLSHELRTPLQAILGWSRLIGDQRLGAEEQSHAIEAIQRNANLQAQLIEDILDVSRIISGKLRLDVRTTDLASVIEAAVESVLPAAQAKGVRLQRVLDSSTSLVSGDPNRLQQVVWNLISNAIKFTPKGGRVQVRLERINSHVEIIVSDTGAGISADVLPYVFDRFRQADSTSTRQHGGLGLGLAIVRHIVEMHGGTAEAHSLGEGTGATFTVKLPLIATHSYQNAEQDADDERVHPTAGGRVEFECPPELDGLHVLLVDDDEDARFLVQTVLETCKAKVTAVDCASDALALLQELRPDVLISDLGMPDEDGYSLILRVRALPPERGGQTPAAALTAYARVEDRMKVLRSGFQIHLPKPVEPAELVTVVASLVGRFHL